MYHILIDMDGVLADIVSACMARYPNKPYPFPPELRGHDGNWDFWRYWGIAEHEFWGGFKKDFWENIPIYPWAHQLVRTCEDIVGVENVGILTHPEKRSDGCYDGKKAWIRTHLGPDYVDRLVAGQAKKFCARPTTLLIDDSEKNGRSFVRAGGKFYLWPADWNHRYTAMRANPHEMEIPPPSIQQKELLRLRAALTSFVGYY